MRDAMVHYSWDVQGPKYKCTKCGYVDKAALEVTHKEFAGRYCMKCYTKWLSENIPKMYVLDEDPAVEEDRGWQ